MALPDPRRYGSGDASNGVLRLAKEGRSLELVNALRELAEGGRDAEIDAIFSGAPSQPVYARVWDALCTVVEKPQTDEGPAPRVFAIPWVIVCGSGARATLPCVLPDVSGLARVLDANGVFGPSRSVGFGNTLTSIEMLEALRPSEVLQWTQHPAMRDVPPVPIEILPGPEAVHVRFLVGAAIVPPNAPDIVETGANVAAWGTPALRAMAAQLAAPGVQILPMPRPPRGLYSAAYLGRRAGIEAAFNLFMSNVVRRFRSTIGDPEVTLSSHAEQEIRIALTTPLDEELNESFRWPLHPADDVADIEHAITSMISECRLPEPQVEHDLQS
jgi:hypothetical protein